MLQLEAVGLDETTITCTLATLQETAACPQCAQSSPAKHRRYVRSVADLPWAGMKIRLAIHARKFFCRDPSCPQRIFTERLPDIVAPRARRTQRRGQEQRQLALEQRAEAAARTASRQGMPVSPRTLLRLVRARPAGPRSTPCVLGVDDFAFRKGQVYGTIRIDIERHQPIDLVPERTATVLADWLTAHPGVELARAIVRPSMPRVPVGVLRTRCRLLTDSICCRTCGNWCNACWSRTRLRSRPPLVLRSRLVLRSPQQPRQTAETSRQFNQLHPQVPEHPHSSNDLLGVPAVWPSTRRSETWTHRVRPSMPLPTTWGSPARRSGAC